MTDLPYFWLFATIIVFKLCEKMRSSSILAKVPAVILTSVVVYFIFSNLSVSYQEYNSSAGILTYLLFPATIALAYPLVENIELVKNNKRAIGFGVFIATVVSVLTVVFLSKLMSSSNDIILSLIPKSVTTPIALEVSKNIGGIPELTACIVVCTGIFGGLIGHRLLKLFKIKHDLSIGLAIGAASHVLGTSRCIEKKNFSQAAVSGLTLILTAIFTAVLAPLFVMLLFD